MMIANLLVCASALVLGDAQATESKPQTELKQQAVERSPQTKDDTKGTVPFSLTRKSGQSPASEQSQPTAATGLEEKEVDGVRLATIEANIVSYTNQERARYGLPPLAVDKELMTTAREHAAWMTRNRSMVHTRRPVAENIAMGQPHSSDVVRSWMNSSGHRANILNAGHLRIGVAAFRTDNGTIFWCQQFRR